MKLVSSMFILLFAPMLAEAQSPPITVGARVRITAANSGFDKHVTTVTERRADSMVVAVNGRQRTVALGDISSLEVSAGRRMRVLPFALLGLGVGALGGYAIGYASYAGGSFLSNSASDEGAWVGAAFGALGLVTGGIVGVFSRGDNWVPVQPVLKASIGGTRERGVSLTITRAF